MVKRKQNKFQMNQRITCKKKSHYRKPAENLFEYLPSSRDFLKLRPYLEKKNHKSKE